MPEVTLAAETGRRPGSRPAARLRAEGKIPAVIYGHGTDPISIAVDARALRSALSGEAGTNALLNLRLDSGGSHLTLAKEIQRHPVRHTVSHVDFVIVRRDEVVTTEVPLALVGEAEAVAHGDGVVDQQLHALSVSSRPTDIPNVIEVDISDLEIGSSIRVGDLKLPSGVTAVVDAEQAVVVGQPPQAGAEAEAIEEAAALELGAEGAEAAEAEAEAAPGEEAAGPAEGSAEAAPEAGSGAGSGDEG